MLGELLIVSIQSDSYNSVKMKKVLNKKIEWQPIEKAYLEGATVAEIAMHFNLKPSQVSSHMTIGGLSRRRSMLHPGKPWPSKNQPRK